MPFGITFCYSNGMAYDSSRNGQSCYWNRCGVRHGFSDVRIVVLSAQLTAFNIIVALFDVTPTNHIVHNHPTQL